MLFLDYSHYFILNDLGIVIVIDLLTFQKVGVESPHHGLEVVMETVAQCTSPSCPSPQFAHMSKLCVVLSPGQDRVKLLQ
jgi:hypothetical protein